MDVKSTLAIVKPIAKDYCSKAITFIGKHKVETGLSVAVGALLIDNVNSKKELSNEREKNRAFQEILKKHQAEINSLKSTIEREKYKNKLWEEFLSPSEE